MSQQACPVCGRVHGTRKNLGIKATMNESDAFSFILNQLNCADQALQMLNYPDGTTQDQINKFVAASLEYKAIAQYSMRKWWEEVIQKYKLMEKSNGAEVQFDSADLNFFILTSEE